jgi:hypothetical protein
LLNKTIVKSEGGRLQEIE